MNDYQEKSYLWTIQLEGKVQNLVTVLGAGEDWGVLRNEDNLLDFEKMKIIVPKSFLKKTRLGSECVTCKMENLLIHPEEIEQLQSCLPFSCRHNCQVTHMALPLNESDGGETMVAHAHIPRPSGFHPRAKRPEDTSLDSSSSSSSCNLGKIERCLKCMMPLRN